MKHAIYLFLLWFAVGACEKKTYTPENINTDFNRKILDGYFIKCMAFDESGNAWIGTFRQGLIKYNATETVVFNSENSAIPDSGVIYDISVDSENNVWIACEGLIKYDGNSFTRYNSSNTPMPEDFVQSIAIDSRNNVWFTSCRFRQGGIVRYNGAEWTVFTPENSDLPANGVQSIAIDANDNVWLAMSETVGDGRLVRISKDEWTVFTSEDLGFYPFYFGNIRINSRNEVCGAIDYSLSCMIINQGPQVFIFDGKTTETLRFDTTSNIQSITVDDQDNIWCAGFGGYAVYDGIDWLIDNTSFAKESVFAIEQAKDRRMWIGTGSGIFIND